MKGGRLLYKCRLCGEIDRSTHVPNALVAIACLTENVPFPWSGIMVGMFGVCRCTDSFGSSKRPGVADFVGVEEDE